MLTQARRLLRGEGMPGRHTLAAAGMIFALGFSLALGGCGRNGVTSQSGANQTTTTQQGGTTTTGSTPTGNPADLQDLQNLDGSLNAAFSDLDNDQSAASTDYSSQDQEVQP